MNQNLKYITIILALSSLLNTCGETAKEKKDKEDKTLTNLVVTSSLANAAAAANAPALAYTGIPARNGYATSSTFSLTAITRNFTASSYSVSPSLPSGFNLNTSTGAITGTTTTTTQDATNYTVTASSSSGGTLTVTLTIAIVSSGRFCNTSGTFTGCSTTSPFSCSSSSLCYGSYASCLNSSSCGY